MTQVSYISSVARRMQAALRHPILCALLLLCSWTAVGQTPGTEDPSWQTPQQPPEPAGTVRWYDTDTQPGGKLVAMGWTGAGAFVWRYADDGTLDASFGSGGAVQLPNGGSRVSIDGLGRIYVWSSDVDERPRTIARLLPDGAPDASFGSGGAVTVEGWVTRDMELRLLADGILLVGYGQDDSYTLARKLLADGRSDTGFGTNGELMLLQMGTSTFYSTREIVATPDGGFIVAFNQTGGNREAGYLRKWTATGAVDASFGVNGEVSAGGLQVQRLAPLPNGQVLVGFTRYAAETGNSYFFARLTPAGALDTSFGNGGVAPVPAAFWRIAIEAGGGIVVATDPLDQAPSLRRFTANGTLDGSFVSAPIADMRLEDLEIGNGIFALTSSNSGAPDFLTSRNLRKFVLPPPPRSGSRSTGEASTSSFRIAVEDFRAVPVTSTRTTHEVGVHGYVYPQGSDLGARADLFVVVGTSRGYFMRNTSGVFVPWNEQPATLVPAYEDLTLATAQHVPVYSGRLPFADTYRVYVGYQREGGPLIYIDTPGLLSVQ